jgi:hypothetical protein
MSTDDVNECDRIEVKKTLYLGDTGLGTIFVDVKYIFFLNLHYVGSKDAIRFPHDLFIDPTPCPVFRMTE